MAYDGPLTKITLTGSYNRKFKRKRPKQQNTQDEEIGATNIQKRSSKKRAENIPLRFFANNNSVYKDNFIPPLKNSSLEQQPPRNIPIEIKRSELKENLIEPGTFVKNEIYSSIENFSAQSPQKPRTIKPRTIDKVINPTQYPEVPPKESSPAALINNSDIVESPNHNSGKFTNSIKSLLINTPEDTIPLKNTPISTARTPITTTKMDMFIPANNNLNEESPITIEAVSGENDTLLSKISSKNGSDLAFSNSTEKKQPPNIDILPNVAKSYLKLCQTLESLDSKISSFKSQKCHLQNTHTPIAKALIPQHLKLRVSNAPKIPSQSEVYLNIQNKHPSNIDELPLKSSPSKNNNIQSIPHKYLPNKDFEKKANPEFFSKSLHNTPERFVKIRNFILERWDITKPKYLTKLNSRNGLTGCGDVNLISRIHSWLEKIKAINHETSTNFGLGISLEGSDKSRKNRLSENKSKKNRDLESVDKYLHNIENGPRFTDHQTDDAK
ncbi:Histone H2A deubiquitinase MYSM1 [Smittium mucronatum]|uniref:Histone H2A deubiquitinase MYSM1 n=1 Tax=Smittium mucronatum TaxID=133383 RepID=A0A1R0GMT6_9FUNG|nr:Histone H2A deubiquitinase MYSM1 [Smittium mucronatum]